ncbi:hybrid sensor histidine kinase/response regulator [Aquiflexum gelatinilyticum]|uniref:hybrid sensor histidine kinase/response regulator n=1 Tax=Aquiflexum gelatinilyticum TaxID=2961943 RepID=UPI00216A2D0F|nr:hybrid sensor histidine kinase/response regulator [Aquiflexum gelatinilyticum]MCS4436235.1 response regulator [Aquiflexum gelatinilyticum]
MIKQLCAAILLTFVFFHEVLSQQLPHSYPSSIHSTAEIVDLGDLDMEFDKFLNAEDTLEFIPLINLNTNLGFTDSNYWVRFKLSHEEDFPLKLYLETARPITDIVDLYQVNKTRMVVKLHSGDLGKVSDRPLYHRNIIFPITLHPGEEYQFYLHLSSDGEVINLPLRLFDSESMIRESYFNQLVFGAFYGFLLLAGIIYLFFYFGIKEKSFLLYTAYVTSIIFLHLGLDGYFYQYITPNGGWFSKNAVLIFATVSAIAFGRYAQVYLSVKDYSTKIHQSFNILLFSLIGLLVLIFTFQAGMKYYYPLVNLLGILILFHVIASLISGYIHGKSPDIFFSLGIAAFFLGFMVFILNNFNLIPNSDWTEFSSKIGTGLEVMFLSLSMSNRIKILKTDKEKMQAVALQRAQESNEIKSFFLSNISHEMRTPLNAIIGLSRSIQESVSDQKTKDEIEVIQYSSAGLLSAIDDILDYSRIEKKELKLEYKSFDFHRLLKEIRSNCEKQAGDKGLKFIYEEINQIPQFIIGDLHRTRQILFNLLGNAIKFTFSGEVRLSIQTSAKGRNSVGLVFKISDTGVGIQKEKLDSIFESFIQEQIDDKRKFGGFGLGLCIVKALVEQYGGKLDLQSEQGKGTQVMVDLNFETIEQKTIVENDFIKKGIYDLQGKNILVVEDNPVNQLVMKSILKKWKNTTFDTAMNGLEALEKLSAGKFDLILMDLQMPEMDGYEATEAIRKGDCGDLNKSIPIIAVTADATEKAKKKVMEVGMDEYITKPVDQEELFIKVKKCLYLQTLDISQVF